MNGTTKRGLIADTVGLLGLVMTGAGVWLAWGLAFALIVSGVALLAVAIFAARNG